MKIGILGAATMGAGIIQICAQHGYEVVFRARRQSSIDLGYATVEKSFDFMISKGWLTAQQKEENMKRIHGSTDINIIRDADIIIEASTEDYDAKKALFSEIDKICKPEAIIATNTSCLSITELASVTSRPSKVIGMHFFNPAPVMKLVEIIRGYDTSDETFYKVNELALKLEKTPVEVKESPGFVVNRMLVPMINEAVGILAEGLARAEDIDNAMKLGANHPMGPLALADLVGLDICLTIMETLQNELGEDKYRPHPLLRKMVRAGKFGRKTGEGFYKYG